jgi:SAM-dependent methyltransferase
VLTSSLSGRSDLVSRVGRTAVRTARAAGIDVQAAATFPASAWHFWRDLRDYRRALRSITPDHPLELHPIFRDSRQPAGRALGHYFHQDLWAAKKIIRRSPVEHVDIGSRLDGFIAHLLAADVRVTFVDVRPLPEPVEGLSFVQADATELADFPDSSIDSMSSLHAIEHFGLGRYGDVLDPQGALRACAAFARKLAPGGRLLLSAPVGRERTEFNAHRIFAPETLPRALPGLILRDFAAVDDYGRLQVDVRPAAFEGARFALGLYDFEKTRRDLAK